MGSIGMVIGLWRKDGVVFRSFSHSFITACFAGEVDTLQAQRI